MSVLTFTFVFPCACLLACHNLSVVVVYDSRTDCRWHSKNGGLVVITDEPGLRIDEGDWSTLTLEAFPPRAGVEASTKRLVVPRNGTWDDRTEVRTHIHTCNQQSTKLVLSVLMHVSDPSVFVLLVHVRSQLSFTTDASGSVELTITPPEKLTASAVVSAKQGWTLRLHLMQGERIESVSVDGVAMTDDSVVHIAPVEAGSDAPTNYFPFGGVGSAPAVGAGSVAEIALSATAWSTTRTVTAKITTA